MAKTATAKPAATKKPEGDLGAFDKLSTADFINTIVQDTGAARSNNASEGNNEKIVFTPTGDKEADKILAAAAKQEAAALKVAGKKKVEVPAAADEEEEVEEVEETEEEEIEETEVEETEEEEEEVIEETPAQIKAREAKEKADKIKADKEKADLAAIEAAKKGEKKYKLDKDGNKVKTKDGKFIVLKSKVDPDTLDGQELGFDDTSVTAPALETGEELGWKGIAKDVYGAELATDDYEAFKELVSQRTEFNISKFKPETQRLIQAMEAGLTTDEFLEPLGQIDKTIILSDEVLVDRHLKATGWKDDTKRAAKLEVMVESGEVEILGAQAREKLMEYREAKKNEIIEARLTADKKHKARMAAAPAEEAKEIKAALLAKKEFMNTPLKAENIEKIAKKYAEGVYEKEFKNPEQIAEFLLFKEFGAQGIKNLQIAAKREFKEKHKKLFHNVPPKGGAAGTVRATHDGKEPEGNFDLLEKEMV